jgi:hypothetical protein
MGLSKSHDQGSNFDWLIYIDPISCYPSIKKKKDVILRFFSQIMFLLVIWIIFKLVKLTG